MEDAARSGSRAYLRLAAFAVPGIALISLLAFAVASQGPPAPGDAAPDFEAPLLSGVGSFGLDDLNGRPAVVNFWASWCVPCEDEAPMLERAWRTYGDRVAFVGVNIRDARSDAVEFVDRYGLHFDHVRDESLEIYDAYGLTGQPETFFISPDGTIYEHVNGPMAEPVLFGLIESLVAEA